ncbi:hypothetical protein RDI58_001137 [Solanum bulbocastanum]|uniref:Uncharacterized protein n=1 Tax=Solanum bulbocastanum TaxID=147425 RepID=A0AAN8YMX6_SOLBU
MTNDMRKKVEERDEQMAKFMMSMEILSKHMLAARAKSLNDIGEHSASLLEKKDAYASFDKDIKYLTNQGSSFRP